MDMKHSNNLRSCPLYRSTLDTEEEQGSKMFTKDFFSSNVQLSPINLHMHPCNHTCDFFSYGTAIIKLSSAL